MDSSIAHTKQPHLSLGISQVHTSAFLQVPSSAETRFRRAIIQLGEDGFLECLAAVNKNMKKVAKTAPGAYPYVSMAQRHFPSRNGKAILDADMKFDLRTAFQGDKSQRVKVQPEWLAAVYSLIKNKKSNMSFSIGMAFPYETCKKVQAPSILNSLVASWIACKPLMDVLLQEKSGKTK